MEAETVSETSCFVKKLDDGWSKKRYIFELYITEFYRIGSFDIILPATPVTSKWSLPF